MIRFITLATILTFLTITSASAQLAGVTFLHNGSDPSIPTVDLYVTQSGQTLKVEDISYQTADNLNSVFIFGGIEVTFDVAPATSVDKAESIASHTFTPDADAGYMLVLHGVQSTGDFAANPDGESTELAMTSFNVPFFSGDPNEIGTMFFHGVTDLQRGDARVRGTSNMMANNVVYGTGSPALVDIPRELATVDFTVPGQAGDALASFEVDFSGISSETAIFVASGFNSPVDNQDGEPLSLLAVLETGAVIKYELIAGSQTALVQVVHNAGDPTLQVVDVWLNEERIVDNMSYHDATPFTELAAGTPLLLGLAPFGSTSWEDTLLTVPLEALRAGRKYQIFVHGITDTAAFAPNPNGVDIRVTADIIDGALTESNDDEGRTVVRTVHGSTDDSTLIVRGSDGAVYANEMVYRQITPTYSPAEQITDTLWMIDPISMERVKGWVANLKGNDRATVLMSTGFKNPEANENGPAFKLILIDDDGRVFDNLREVDPPAVSVQEELLSRDQWVMSPNPASSSVTIELPSNIVDGTLLIGVFDVSGANVIFSTANAETGTIQLNTSDLASGTYLVRITQLSGRPVASDQLIIGR